ncbi:MAG TPA: zinc-binding dehydrogenase, partial [Candidatus Binataceae bacterium]|nr:zinc-binding dehydrogenase [Candidatus Binataceae bacterium]
VVPMVYSMRELHRRGLDHVFQLAREGQLTIPLGKTFPLADAVEAVRYLESRQSSGKLLLLP